MYINFMKCNIMRTLVDRIDLSVIVVYRNKFILISFVYRSLYIPVGKDNYSVVRWLFFIFTHV